jgi:hypothetical protein
VYQTSYNTSLKSYDSPKKSAFFSRTESKYNEATDNEQCWSPYDDAENVRDEESEEEE